MSKLSLYRKYRPGDFDSVLGQDHIVSVLKGSLQSEKLAHAYLFSGSRGTGKTSIARILAKELKITANDLYEIDAASNRGIDEVRALREAVNVLPFESKYKVYIIDEVHMMTKDAFNALLKTLEEPPKHVIFILATTEPEKLPETIVSRCQHFRFNRPTRSILREMTKKVGLAEGYKINDGACDLIAFLGDGSFRDTHGILQKVISNSSDKKITEDEVRVATGTPNREIINNFLSALVLGNREIGFLAISKAVELNLDIKLFIRFLSEQIRQIILFRISEKVFESVFGKIENEEKIELKKYAENKQINSVLLRLVLECYGQVQYFYAPEIALEILLEDYMAKND